MKRKRTPLLVSSSSLFLLPCLLLLWWCPEAAEAKGCWNDTRNDSTWGSWTPRCAETDGYEALQCTTDGRWCWCVFQNAAGDVYELTGTGVQLDPSSGEEPDPKMCDNLPEDPPNRHRSRTITLVMTCSMIFVATAMTLFCILRRSRIQAAHISEVLVAASDGEDESFGGTNPLSINNDSITGLNLQPQQQQTPNRFFIPPPPPTPPIPRNNKDQGGGSAVPPLLGLPGPLVPVDDGGGGGGGGGGGFVTTLKLPPPQTVLHPLNPVPVLAAPPPRRLSLDPEIEL